MIQRFGYMKNNPYLCINKKKLKYIWWFQLFVVSL